MVSIRCSRNPLSPQDFIDEVTKVLESKGIELVPQILENQRGSCFSFKFFYQLCDFNPLGMNPLALGREQRDELASDSDNEDDVADQISLRLNPSISRCTSGQIATFAQALGLEYTPTGGLSPWRQWENTWPGFMNEVTAYANRQVNGARPKTRTWANDFEMAWRNLYRLINPSDNVHKASGAFLFNFDSIPDLVPFTPLTVHCDPSLLAHRSPEPQVPDHQGFRSRLFSSRALFFPEPLLTPLP